MTRYSITYSMTIFPWSSPFLWYYIQAVYLIYRSITGVLHRLSFFRSLFLSIQNPYFSPFSRKNSDMIIYVALVSSMSGTSKSRKKANEWTVTNRSTIAFWSFLAAKQIVKSLAVRGIFIAPFSTFLWFSERHFSSVLDGQSTSGVYRARLANYICNFFFCL